MNCLDSLDISAGVTSVAGSGGKTTLLRALSEEIVAARQGTVILATTTHFLPFEGVPLVTGANEAEVERALQDHGIACVGASGIVAGQTHAHVKLGPSPIPIDRLAQLADYVLVEADGSKRLPLKAHAPYEPVIPVSSTQTLLVVGASGFGRPVCEAVHRPELFCERAGCEPTGIATTQLVARCIANEISLGLIHPDRVVVNQADTPRRLKQVAELACELKDHGIGAPVLTGSIRNNELKSL